MEKYLEECIESAIKQSLNDIDIICINDGSTDSSLEILKKYEKKYSNIIVISQENKGLSASRNVGIRKAKGKYIYFLDSDDFIDTNSMELCYKECEKYNLDMVTFDAICFLDKDYVGNDINEDYDRRDLLPKYMLTGEEFYVVSNKSGGYKAPVWLNFYNTDNTIVENITKGEISKLIVEIKGSVNKKISINKVISKETEFILESRRNIFLPNDNEIKEITESLIKKYFNKVNV